MQSASQFILNSVSCTSSDTSEEEEDDDESPQPGSSAVKRKRGPQLPPGYQSITTSSIGSSSLVSSLNAEDVGSSDLWVVRLPSGVKPKHLAGLKLDINSLDSSRLPTRAQKVGETQVANVEYDIFAQQIPSKPTSSKHSQEITPESSEVSQFTPLVPDKKKDKQPTKIIIAPQRVSKVIFFRRRWPKNVVQSTRKPASILESLPFEVVQLKARRAQPDGLELRNVAYGATPIDSSSPFYDSPAGESDTPKIKKRRLH